jgi:hypothetical protein
MLSLIRIVKGWFVDEAPEEITPYADYICPLPPSWIPGEGIRIDMRFTMEQAEEQNYKECVDRLKNTSHKMILPKDMEKE